MKKESNKKYYYIGGIIAVVIIAVIIAILVVSCNRNVKYDVQLLVDNKNYYQDKIRKGDTIKGITDPKKEGYTFVGWYDGDKKVDLNNPIANDTKLEARWEINTYTITIDLGNGDSVTKKVNYNETVTLPEVPTRYGYIFDGWYVNGEKFDSNTKIEKDTTITARWIEIGNVSYTVKHYLMGTDGKYTNTPFTSETFVVKDGTTVKPQPKIYEGFISPSGQAMVVKENGNNVINYYYERCKYDFILVGDNGVLETLSNGKYYYGEKVVIDFIMKPGYTFEGYSEEIENDTYVMPSKNVTIEIITSPNEDTEYTVKHYVMGTDGKYPTEPDYIDNLTGTTDTTVIAEVMELGEGFIIPSEKEVTITGDGKAVVEYRYERRQYTLTLTPSTGIESVEGNGLYYYGQSVAITANVKEGYTFVSWAPINIDKNTFAYFMPNSDTTLTASATPNTDTKYTVKHYVMGLDGKYPTEPDYIDNLTGTTDTTVIAEVMELGEGFIIPSEKEVTITGDGKAVVEYHYERRQFTLNITSDEGIEKTDITVKYNDEFITYEEYQEIVGNDKIYYGTTVNIEATPNEGYSFNKWTVAGEEIEDNNQPTITVIIDAYDLEVKASSKINTYTVTFDAGTDATFEGAKEVEVKYLDKIPKPEVTPERVGYTFAGWLDSENNEWDFENATMPSKDLVLHAKWDLVEYDLKYYYLDNMSEKHYLDNGDNPSKYTIESEDITLTEISRESEGYQFVSFNSDKVKDNILSVKGNIGTIEVELKYSPIDYEIKYYYLDSEGTKQYLDAGTNPTTYNVESNDVTLKEISRVDSGYAFTKLNSDKVNDENSLSLKGKTGNIEIELQYSPIEYTISYFYKETNGTEHELSEVNGNKTNYNVETDTFTLNQIDVEGYTFVRFDNEKLQDGKVVKGTIGDLRIEVVNTLINYTITYNIDGDVVCEDCDTEQTYTVEDDTITLYEATKKGYTFDGWLVNGNDTPIKEFNKGDYLDNITVTPKFTVIEYTITYDLQDGETCTDCDTDNKYTVEGKILPEPTKENFVFDGWEITASEDEILKDTVITEIAKGTTGNLTLKAKWVKLITLEYVDEQLMSSFNDLSTKYDSKVFEDERIVNVDILNTKGQMIGGIGLVMYFTPVGGNIGRVVEIPEIEAIHMQYMDKPEVVCTKEEASRCQLTAISDIMTSLTNTSRVNELSTVPISDLDGKTLTITVDLDGSLAKTKDKKTELVYTLNINVLGYVTAEEFTETVNKIKPLVDDNNKNGEHFTIDDSGVASGNIVLRYQDESMLMSQSVIGMGMHASLSQLAQDPNIDHIEVTLPGENKTYTISTDAEASSLSFTAISDIVKYMKEKTGDPTKDTPSITNDDLRNYKYTVKVKIVLANNGYFETGIPTEYTITFDKSN